LPILSHFLDLQRQGSKESEVKSITSADIKGNMPNHSEVIIRQEEEDNHLLLLPNKNLTDNTMAQIKPGNITTCKTDLNFQKQERSTIVQSGNNLF
jgi:hypothetical protein